MDASGHIVKVFENNWQDSFVFDSLSGRALSYSDFFSAILNCKEMLEKQRFKKGDIIVLLLPNSLELMLLYFAALLMGIIVVPLDINTGDKSINDILSQIRYDGLIHRGYRRAFSEAIDIHSIRKGFFNGRSIREKDLSVFEHIEYDNPFTITFTSGTTGIPKGVMHSFNNFFKASLAFGEKFSFNEGNIFYHNLPMTYMAGILNLIFMPFLSESKLVIGKRFDVSSVLEFWETPVKYSVNTFFLIPSIVSLLLKFDRDSTGVDYADRTDITSCVGIAPLNKTVQHDFEKKYNTSLYESYGLSEMLFVSTNSPVRYGTGVGEILDGVSVDLLDDEILIDSPWKFLSYWNLSADRYFIDEKFISGDLGRFDGNNLVITGRKKDLIIKGGVNISPRKIEDFINDFSIFDECAVTGTEDIVLGEKVTCFHTPCNSDLLFAGIKKLNRSILETLGANYRIDEFFELPEIPKNANGKTDKLEIMELYNIQKR
jgi:long-chain acyl-CoA synthetase